MLNATLNLARDQELFPMLAVCYCITDTEVVTFWYERDTRIIQHWDSSLGPCSVSTITQKAEEHGLHWK